MLFLRCCDFIVSLTQSRITWEDSLNEALSQSGGPVGVSLMDCLVDVHWCVMEDLFQCGEHRSLGSVLEHIRMKKVS